MNERTTAHTLQPCPDSSATTGWRLLRGSVAALATLLLLGLPSSAWAVCGDTVLEPGEQCEAPFGGCCNQTTCQLEPSGTLCRAGSGDACDPDETCTGLSDGCPSDVVLGAGTVCYAGSGDLCDPDQVCSGNPTEACPAPATEPATTVCRAGSSDLCDPDELCPGVAGVACPADSFEPATTVCRTGSGDVCDPDELCTGVAGAACPADSVEPVTTVCRGGSGDACDPDEMCTGIAGQTCPADSFEPATTICRAGSGDLCDPDELCTGVAGQACPSDSVQPGTTVCRAGSGDVCDPEELCTGVAGQACPADSVSPGTTVCRAGSGDSCDPDETCTGVAGQTCPADSVEPATTVCRAGSSDLCDPDELCTGVAGETCPSDSFEPATTVCRPGSGDLCDPDELCTGNAGEACPTDSVEPATTLCRSGSGDLCDPAELCTGVAGQACPANAVEPATTVCRAGSGDLCDVDELCTGNAGEACPADVLEPATTVCRTGSGDSCDPDELCTGTPGVACPSDFVEPATTVCRPGSGDPNGTGFVCDPDELCTGNVGEQCPSDTFTAGGVVCNPGSGDPEGSGVVCDPDEACPGTAGGACPTDVFADAGTVCRPGSGTFDGLDFTCDANERCPGVADGACPADFVYPSNAGQLLRATRDTRTMETHRSSNNGATGLFWLKRSPNVRGLIGFDTSCQGQAIMDELDCALLDMSIHDGVPTVNTSTFSAYVMNAEWVEGNQAFDSFSWKGQSLGSFPGSGIGTTWACRIDLDLEAGGQHDCDEEDRWWGGDICGSGLCYNAQSSYDAPYLTTSQENLTFDVTSDLVAHASDISWLLKVTDEEDINSGAVKLYQRDGARFIAETDPTTPPHVAFDLAPRLVLFSQSAIVPQPVLVEPASMGAVGNSIDVAVDQVGAIGGDPPRWENKTLGTWGYMSPGVIEDWEATIPLQGGPNEVEFTVFDSCNTEGQATYTLTSAAGIFCGNGIVESGEECDDGNGVSGDCCSGTCEIEPDGSVCDDGDVCTAASTCAAATCVGTGRSPAACGDSYMCYKASVTKKTTPFFPVTDFDLTDPFGANQVDIRLPRSVCLPAAVDGGTVLSTEAHRIGYKMKESTKRALPPGVQVTDRFGTITIDPQKTARYLAGASYQLDSAPAPLTPGLVDHHECYSAKLSLGKFPKGTTAMVAESLEDRTYGILKPSHLCLAVDANGAGVMNPNAHLMCYRVKRASGESKHDKVRNRIHVEDDFGTLELDTRREEELCVPATIDGPIL